MKPIGTIRFRNQETNDDVVVHVQKGRDGSVLIILESPKDPGVLAFPKEHAERLLESIREALSD